MTSPTPSAHATGAAAARTETPVVELKGMVENILYSADNGFHVLLLRPPAGPLITACGFMPRPTLREDVTLSGHWGFARGKREFFFERVNQSALTDPAALIGYLSSTLGIGAQDAGRIVEHFGANTIAILTEQPAQLASVKGISKATLKAVAERWRAPSRSDEAYAPLRRAGVPGDVVQLLVTQYGAELDTELTTNPFLPYLRFPERVTFATIETYARERGYPRDGSARVQAGVVHLLSQHALAGHVFLELSVLAYRLTKTLGLSEQLIDAQLPAVFEQLASIEIAALVQGRAHLCGNYAAETGIVDRLRAIAKTPCAVTPTVSPERARGILARLTGFEPPAAFCAELIQALSEPIVLLNGIPVHHSYRFTLAIVRLYALQQIGVHVLTANHHTASRLRAADPDHQIQVMPYGELMAVGDESPLRAEAVFILEADRFTSPMLQRVLSRVADDAQVILLGDTGRHPPVGPGQPFRDLQRTRKVRVLTPPEDFVDPESRALRTQTSALLAGAVEPAGSTDLAHDALACLYVTPGELKAATQLIVHEVAPALGFTQPSDILVVSPIRKGNDGAPGLDELNGWCMEAFGWGEQVTPLPPGRQRAALYAPGIPVLTRQDLVKHGVSASERGPLERMDPKARRALVHFGDHEVQVGFDEFDAINPAMAVTARLATSLQAELAIVILLHAHNRMLQREVFLSALSCARQRVIVLAEHGALAKAIAPQPPEVRDVYLPELLKVFG